jgi:chromosome partitioning protein
MILSLISQKGGVGKSTLARLVGVEMARAGWRVMIADLDAAQGTATAWKLRRDRIGIEPVIDVQKFRSVERALAEAARFDLLILDGPAHAERGGLTMATHSDLILLPSGYSLDDLEPQIKVAFELEEAGIAPAKIRIALGRVRGSKKEGAEVRDYLKAAGLTPLNGELRELQTTRQAHMQGRAASETAFSRINEEAQTLAAEIADVMLSSTQERKAI